MVKDRLISSGWHWSYGWLRRSDMDDENGYCYEEPDGDLVYTARRDHRTACYLECRHDERTGENYLCLSEGSTREMLRQFGRHPRRVDED